MKEKTIAPAKLKSDFANSASTVIRRKQAQIIPGFRLAIFQSVF